MKRKKSFIYYLLLFVVPLSYLLQNVNQNFGLISTQIIIHFLLIYSAITWGIAFFSRLLLKDDYKAFLFSFFVSVVYFLFGMFHDNLKTIPFVGLFASYKYFIPLTVLICWSFFLVLKKRKNLYKPAQLVVLFLAVNLLLQTGWLFYNTITRADVKQNLADTNHTLIKNLPPVADTARPYVFWFVFDEYLAPASFKKIYNYTNPLNTLLRSKGFFVADSAISNYGYTHYSLSSTLDMIYLPAFNNRTSITLRDLLRGELTLADNNTIRLFERSGYKIENFTIFNNVRYPAKGTSEFGYVPSEMINYQTMAGKLKEDIGFHFYKMFSRHQNLYDSITGAETMKQRDGAFQDLAKRSMQSIRDGALQKKPIFFMCHYMLPHSPYIYHEDGSLAFEEGLNDLPKNYTMQVKYSNRLIESYTDSIIAHYKDKKFIIIFQGDHGYKFDKKDPYFETDRYKILYAVYCSDKNYEPWQHFGSSVNGFRILFNKYFHYNFPMLPDKSIDLFYTR